MVETIQNQFENELNWWKKNEIDNLIKDGIEQEEKIKQVLRFRDVAKYADDFPTTHTIDIGKVVKLNDKNWVTTLYMMEKGKKGGKDTYYVLTFRKEIMKFELGIAYWKDLWGKFEKNMVNVANKFLKPQEADVILKKFEKKVKKQKDDKILEQRILWK